MKLIRKAGLLFGLIFLCSPALPLNSETMMAAEIVEEAKLDGYFRWFGIYDDYNQLALDSAVEMMRQLIEEADSSMTMDEVKGMLNIEGYEESLGESKFLRYYSINDETSLLLYIQFYPAEDDVYTLYMIETQIVSDQFFHPFGIDREDIDHWQETEPVDREIQVFDDLTEIIGPPSIINYNFQHERFEFTWERDSVVFPAFNYIQAEVDTASNITSLSYIE